MALLLAAWVLLALHCMDFLRFSAVWGSRCQTLLGELWA
jgi:hypothetical protein